MPLLQRFKAGFDSIMVGLGYYHQSAVFMLQDQHVAIADRDRQDKERLVLALTQTDAFISDLRETHSRFKALPADANRAEVLFIAEQQDRLIEGLAIEADRRMRLREQARQRGRDPAGRFLPRARDAV